MPTAQLCPEDRETYATANPYPHGSTVAFHVRGGDAMTAATAKTIADKLAAEVARARMWERMGDHSEADKCHARIDYLLEQHELEHGTQLDTTGTPPPVLQVGI